VSSEESGVISPTVRGLSIVSLFNDFASEMIYPLLPAFVIGTLGGTATSLGTLDGAADLTAAVAKWISGRLSDRPGWRRPLILGGYLSAVLIRPLISFAGAAWQVVGFRVLDRVGKGLRTPPRDALLAAASLPTQQGRAFGFQRAADHFGAVLGSLTAWYLLQRAVEVRRVIAWSAVPGVTAFGILFFVLRGAPRSPVLGSHSSPRTDATGRVFWAPVLALAALTLFRVPEALLLLRLQDLGVAVVIVPLVWAGLHVVRTAASYPGGWIGDHVGPRRAVTAGGALFGIIAWVLGTPVSSAVAVASFLVLGVVAGLTESSERLLVARLAPVRTGRGFGAYHAVTGLAVLPAGVFFGALYHRAGGQAAMWTSAVTMTLAAVLWVLVAANGHRVGGRAGTR